jgi:hypothetical protein
LEVKNNNSMNQNNMIKGFDKSLIYILLILISFSAVLHILFPIILISASLFNILIPYSITLYVFFKNIYKMSSGDIVRISAFIISAFLIILVRSVVYDEQLYKLMQGDIYILFIPIIFLIFKHLLLTKRDLIVFRSILIIIFVINLINSFLFSIGSVFFETVSKDSISYIAESRYSGLFGGPNLSSSALLIIVLIYLFTSNKFNIIKILIISLLFLIVVLPNLSRGPIFLFFICLVLFVINNFKSNKINFFYMIIFGLLLFLLGFYIFTTSYFTTSVESFSLRTEELDSENGRWDRFLLTINLLYDSFLSFFIGVKGENQTKSEFISISDNSLTLLLANFGLFFTFFFVQLITKFIKMFKSVEKNKIIFTIAVVLIGVINNAVLWTVWVFYVALGYKLIATSEEFQENKKSI